MPATAILRHDLGTLASSWLIRTWLFASALLTFLLVSTHWGDFQTAPLVALVQFPFLVFPWFLIVIMLGVGPVSSARNESLSDGILSRPVTRYEYLLASWAARVVAVLGVYLLVVVPAILLVTLARRPVPDDAVTLYGIVGSVVVVALVLVLQVSLGFLLGTLLKRPMVAVAVLAFAWFVAGSVLNTFHLEEFSPISLNQALPTLLRQSWRQTEPVAQQTDLTALADSTAKFMSVFTGAPAPKQEPRFFESEDYQDFSLLRVLFGYGVPTLLAVGLATLCFCRRDL